MLVAHENRKLWTKTLLRRAFVSCMVFGTCNILLNYFADYVQSKFAHTSKTSLIDCINDKRANYRRKPKNKAGSKEWWPETYSLKLNMWNWKLCDTDNCDTDNYWWYWLLVLWSYSYMHACIAVRMVMKMILNIIMHEYRRPCNNLVANKLVTG